MLLSGFHPSTFLQPVNSSKNSTLNWVLKLNLFKSVQVFFVCLSRKTIDRFFTLLHHYDQEQFLLPHKGPSNLILDCVAIWQFLIMNLHEWNQIVLLHPYFVNQWCRLFFVQFYNFHTISHWSLLTLFVCLFCFFSLCFLVTNRFY